MDAAQNAGQRLDHGRIFERHVIGNFEHVLLDDSRGNSNVFGVGAVIEQ